MPPGQHVRAELGRVAELLLFGGQASLGTGSKALRARVGAAIARLLTSEEEVKPPYHGVLLDVRQFGRSALRCTGPLDGCSVDLFCGTTGQPWPAV